MSETYIEWSRSHIFGVICCHETSTHALIRQKYYTEIASENPERGNSNCKRMKIKLEHKKQQQQQ